MSRATAALLGFLAGAAAVTVLNVGRLFDLHEEVHDKVEREASYRVGRAEGRREGYDQALNEVVVTDDADERRADPAARA